MFGLTSPLHWIVLLVIVVLIFGTKKLRNVGSDVGGAVKNFKDAMRDGQETSALETERTVLEAEEVAPIRKIAAKKAGTKTAAKTPATKKTVSKKAGA